MDSWVENEERSGRLHCPERLGFHSQVERDSVFRYSAGSRGYGGLYGFAMLCTLSGENAVPAP